MKMLPVSQVLRLYRSVATADHEAVTEGLQKALLKNLQDYIVQGKNDDKIDANMWLSILDTA